MTQDGAKTTAKFEAEIFGSLAGTGTVDGNKVSFSLTVPDGDTCSDFRGTVDGSKMSGKTEMGGVWSATRRGVVGGAMGENLPCGTVTDFRVESLELGDEGRRRPDAWVKFGSATHVVMAAPGKKT